MAWPGGKDGAGTVQRLINQIPPHDVFISAFLGDCAIMRRKLPARVSIGIDRDRENIQRWLTRNDLPGLSPRLYCACGITWLRHAFELDRVHLEERPPNVAPLKRPIRDRPPLISAASADVIADESSDQVPRAFVYLDPPYLLESRRSTRRLYAQELTDAEHNELLDTALRLPCAVMVSHYPHRLYTTRLRGWRSFTFWTQTRGGRPAEEQVWCNYPPPAELHDARYIGANKRERERVRRRVRNWTAGLERMDPRERQAILNAIESRYLARS